MNVTHAVDDVILKICATFGMLNLIATIMFNIKPFTCNTRISSCCRLHVTEGNKYNNYGQELVLSGS